MKFQLLHCYLNLDDDDEGVAIPYVVTADLESRKILCIRRNYDENEWWWKYNYRRKITKTIDDAGVVTTTSNTIKGTVNNYSDFVYDLGATGILKLANGAAINVGANSGEALSL